MQGTCGIGAGSMIGGGGGWNGMVEVSVAGAAGTVREPDWGVYPAAKKMAIAVNTAPATAATDNSTRGFADLRPVTRPVSPIPPGGTRVFGL